MFKLNQKNLKLKFVTLKNKKAKSFTFYKH